MVITRCRNNMYNTFSLSVSKKKSSYRRRHYRRCRRCAQTNVAQYSKSMIGINAKLRILAHHDKVRLRVTGHNSERYSFGVMSFFNYF